MVQEFEVLWDRLDPAHPPVVLLGGISLVRTLGLAGIPVIVASSDRLEPAFASRYCVGRCQLPPFDSPVAAITVLLSLGKVLMRHFGVRIPLMYGNDDAQEWIHNCRDELQCYFNFLLNDPEVATALIDKDAFQTFGKSRGLLTPRALSWEGEGPDSLRRACGQVLVKPKLKLDWHQSEIFHCLFGGAGKALVFSSAAEILSDPVIQRFRRQLQFQEYIPGTDPDLWSFHGFADERGDLLASFVGRKVRTYPIDNGESSFIELAYNDELSAVGREVVGRCPLRGVFKMDFKRGRHDGRWYLLEINARFNLWHHLGAVNGINLPAIVYQYLLFGERSKLPSAYETRFRWLNWPLDVKAYRQLAKRHELAFRPWMLSILHSKNVYSMFDWKDRRPWLYVVGDLLRRRWRRGPGQTLGALRQWLSSAS